MSAGLPNITGNIETNVKGGTRLAFENSNGSLIASGSFGSRFDVVALDTGYANAILFDASRSSTIYGNSETVQPASTTILFLVKY